MALFIERKAQSIVTKIKSVEAITFVITYSKQQAANEVVIIVEQMRNGRKVVVIVLLSSVGQH